MCDPLPVAVRFGRTRSLEPAQPRAGQKSAAGPFVPVEACVNQAEDEVVFRLRRDSGEVAAAVQGEDSGRVPRDSAGSGDCVVVVDAGVRMLPGLRLSASPDDKKADSQACDYYARVPRLLHHQLPCRVAARALEPEQIDPGRH